MKIQNMTKQFKGVYNSYLNANNGDNLFKIYDRPSEEKWKALEYCKKLYSEMEGASNFQIIVGNTYQFSVGFMQEENGNIYFIYITRDYDRKLLIKDGIN